MVKPFFGHKYFANSSGLCLFFSSTNIMFIAQGALKWFLLIPFYSNNFHTMKIVDVVAGFKLESS